jgi:hypothetical protein
MTDEIRRENRDKINLFINIAGPIVILAVFGWMSWSFNIRLKSDIAEEAKHTAETYVPKAWFEQSHKETIGSIEKLTDKVEKLNDDTLTIKGALNLSIGNYKSISRGNGSIPQN